MKLLSRLIVIAVLAVSLISCGGGSHSKQDSRLVGTWVADRITGDQDADNDQSTLVYRANGTGEVFTPEGPINILWETDNGQITTTLVDSGASWTTTYDLNETEDQGDFTTMVGEATITEDYHKVTQNYPEELVGSWGCTSIVANGQNGACADVAVLQLQADGNGSVLWCVTEGAFVWRNPETQLGGVVAYQIEGETLTITEDDDTGLTVTTYQRLLL